MDLALASTGAQISTSTSFDANHPAENIIDGNNDTFWVSTGHFPQEFVLQLGTACNVSRIRTKTTNVARLVVERCEGPSPSSWEKVLELSMEDSDGRVQLESTQTRCLATFLKFKIMAGWEDFATVHSVSVEGRSARE